MSNAISYWFLINLVLCLAPILLVYVFVENSLHQVFSSFITFNYTFLVVSVHSFEKLLKVRTEEDKYADTKRAATWVIIVVLLVVFVLYNFQERLINLVNSNTISIFLITFVITLFLSLNLNIPVIAKNVAEEKKFIKIKKPIERAEKIEEKRKLWEKELEKE